jgi:hypothetical protein
MKLVSLCLILGTIAGCKKDSMRPLRDTEAAMLAGTPLPTLPACTTPDETCANTLAHAFGGAAFNAKAPDQASAGAMAIMLVRHQTAALGDDPEPWLRVLRAGKGPGSDALRLATSARLTAIMPGLAKSWPNSDALHGFVREVASAVPGACTTYVLISSGKSDAELPALLHWRTSACLHKDVTRRDGPGAGYAPDGTRRTAAGARAILHETVRALRAGAEFARPEVRARLLQELVMLEQRVEEIKLDLPKAEADATREYLGKVHGDVGIELWKRDGGADAAVDASPVGTRKLRSDVQP